MIARTPDRVDTPPFPRSDSFFRRRLLRWSLGGLALFTILLVACLFFMPQSYTAKLSLSFAASTGGGGGAGGLLASVTGVSTSPATKYLGVIRSRGFAKSVIRKLSLNKLYDISNPDDMTDMLLDGLTVTDNVRDGLLYITVSLPGPPRLSRGNEAQKQAIRLASARATNLYVDLLKNYMTTADMDSDSILLNGASAQLKQARADYDSAVQRLVDFVQQNAGVNIPIETETPGTTGTPDAASAAKDMLSLYAARADLESEIMATQAAQKMGQTLQANQLQNLSGLPIEDPLLLQARANVRQLKDALDNKRVLLGPQHPDVIADQERLQIAEKKLKQQVAAIQKGLTTDNVANQVKLKSLQTKYETVTKQIGDAEAKAKISRELAATFEQKRNEVLLRLEVLKTMSSQAAILSMQVVSAQNRVQVVDNATPPRTGSPGIVKLGFLCALLTLVAVALWIHLEYSAFLRARNRMALAKA